MANVFSFNARRNLRSVSGSWFISKCTFLLLKLQQLFYCERSSMRHSNFCVRLSLFFIVNCKLTTMPFSCLWMCVCVCVFIEWLLRRVLTVVVLQLHSGRCLKFSVSCMFIGNNNNIIFVATLFLLPMCGYRSGWSEDRCDDAEDMSMSRVAFDSWL